VNRSTRSAALAIALVFGANGAMFASWVSRIPAVRDRIDATEPEMGLAILGLAVGAMVSMPSTSRLCDRFGIRRVLVTAILADLVLFQLVAWVPSPAALGLVLLVSGVAFGMWDVSMNAAAHAHEVDVDRPLMPRFHAAFSGGALAGAAVGALAAGVGLHVGLHLGLVALSIAAIVLVVGRHLPGDLAADRAAAAPHRSQRRTPRRRLTLKLVLIGLITVCTTLGEGAAADWGALFLHDERGASQGLAAAGFAAFALAMMAGRLVGTDVLERLGRVRALQASGLLVALSTALVLSVPSIATGLVGFVGWGAGVALVFPAAMSAGAEAGTTPSHGIAVVATIGYGGFLLGPPIVGFLAGAFGLGVALWVVVVMALVLVALAPAASPPPGTSPRTGEAEASPMLIPH
jgi:MFS family permease